MTINIPVSVGEIVDKISILKIKLIHIKEHYQHIVSEIDLLTSSIQHLNVTGNYLDSLFDVNKQLWDVEDKIREKEKAKQFDQDFISLARKVYTLNDQRFSLKKKINEEYNSEIKEFKSYKDYV